MCNSLFSKTNDDKYIDYIFSCYETVDFRATDEIKYLKSVSEKFRTLFQKNELTNKDRKFIHAMGDYIQQNPDDLDGKKQFTKKIKNYIKTSQLFEKDDMSRKEIKKELSFFPGLNKKTIPQESCCPCIFRIM